jgi:hypothetical protein
MSVGAFEKGRQEAATEFHKTMVLLSTGQFVETNVSSKDGCVTLVFFMSENL